MNNDSHPRKSPTAGDSAGVRCAVTGPMDDSELLLDENIFREDRLDVALAEQSRISGEGIYKEKLL